MDFEIGDIYMTNWVDRIESDHDYQPETEFRHIICITGFQGDEPIRTIIGTESRKYGAEMPQADPVTLAMFWGMQNQELGLA